MKKLTFIICFLLGTCILFARNPPSKDRDVVRSVLLQQQQAWNKGDIEGFMQSYWQSDSLTFIGKKGVTMGWQATFDNYKKAYPDKAAMGQLQFDIVSMKSFSPTTIFVIGKWSLTREEGKGDLGGYFTLVFKKINKQWVIVSDHTS